MVEGRPGWSSPATRAPVYSAGSKQPRSRRASPGRGRPRRRGRRPMAPARRGPQTCTSHRGSLSSVRGTPGCVPWRDLLDKCRGRNNPGRRTCCNGFWQMPGHVSPGRTRSSVPARLWRALVRTPGVAAGQGPVRGPHLRHPRGLAPGELGVAGVVGVVHVVVDRVQPRQRAGVRPSGSRWSALLCAGVSLTSSLVLGAAALERVVEPEPVSGLVRGGLPQVVVGDAATRQRVVVHPDAVDAGPACCSPTGRSRCRGRRSRRARCSARSRHPGGSRSGTSRWPGRCQVVLS